jgi:3-(3-hydroxy-phenyl)propionate hydroxylase
MAMTRHAVIIVGGGPAGLMLASELALLDVDVAIVERRPSQDLQGSRAGGLHSRTIEVLDQRGIADRFVSQGQRHPAVHFHVPLDISELPSRHNYVLALWQNEFERILAERVVELAVPIYRGIEARNFSQHDDGVDVTLSDGRTLRSDYLVGCDGGRSHTRKAAGIAFPGWEPTTSWLIAEVATNEEPAWGFRHDAVGTHAIGKLDGGKRARIVLTEQRLETSTEPTLHEISAALIAIYGTDYGIHDASWISRFTDMARQAETYRDRRVLLAGDAAHIHPPMGGQGLNIGVQDAVNLGWKLAQVIKRSSPDSLLDTYHAERHPVAARVLQNTLAQMALRRPDDRSKALGNILSELLRMREPRTHLGAMVSGLDVQYDLGEGHPLPGRRMPDLDLITENGPQRLFTLLHQAHPVLLNLAEAGSLDAWKTRVRVVDAQSAATLALPALGAVAAPTGVLIRPDGYVAWVGDHSQQGLAEALSAWVGESASALR